MNEITKAFTDVCRNNALLGLLVSLFVFGTASISHLLPDGHLASESVAVAVAAGVFASFARKWHQAILAKIEIRTEHLKAVAILSNVIGGAPLYWSQHALAPEALLFLLYLIQALRARSVLELGSGISTLFVAKVFNDIGHGRVDSFDHDEHWAQMSAAALAERGLARFANVVAAPLVDLEFRGHTVPWYSLPAAVAGRSYDFIIVDGPPSWQGNALSRLPALYRLRAVMTSNSVLVLDDANRHWEIAIANRWRRDFPELNFWRLPIGRGLLVVSESSEVSRLLPDWLD